MVNLIIEGPDLAGKSTAIEQISKHFKKGFLVKNLYKPDHSHDLEIYKQYWEMLKMINNSSINFFILDRFFPSQAVYSILREDDEMNCEEIQELESYCVNNEFVYIYITAPLFTLQSRFIARGDEHIKIEQLALLTTRYNQFYEQTKLPKIMINTMHTDWLKNLDLFIQEN